MSIARTASRPFSIPTDTVIWSWLVTTAALTVCMVVVGGITRLTLSGLSITEWQPVAGVLPPLTEPQWQQAFLRYQQIPEYREIHLGMSLDDFKGIFLWEYLHRLLGRVTGLVALLPPLVLLATGRATLKQAPLLIGVPVLVALQGLLGWYMVKSGLSVRTSVSQYRLTAHLATALLLYATCVWQAASLRRPPISDGQVAGLRRGASGVLGLVCLTILAGGFVAGTKAGLVYNTFPLMDGRVVPNGYFLLDPWWSNPFENVTAIQFDHRVLAITTAAAVMALWGAARRFHVPSWLRRRCDFLLGAVLLQVALGIATLVAAVPIALAAAHQLSAVLLLTASLLVRQGLATADRGLAPIVRQPFRA